MLYSPDAKAQKALKPGDKLEILLKGYLKEIKNNYYHILPTWEGDSVIAIIEREYEKIVPDQHKLFFKLLNYHAKYMKDYGFFSVEDVYPVFKVWMQRTRPFLELWEYRDTFSIKEINKDEEFTTVIDCVNQWLIDDFQIDTSKFWEIYFDKYAKSGYKGVKA